MAHFQITCYSNALHRRMTFQAWIPNDRRTDIPGGDAPRPPMKTLFALHGYTGMSENWVPEEMMDKYNIAVVSASAENSFYLDAEASGHQFETMVAVELVDYVRKTFGLAMRPEETYIAGISMGGYGAVHLGLKYPDRFGKIGMLSAALLVHGLDGWTADEPDRGMLGNYAFFRETFGDLTTVAVRDTNPEVQIRSLKAAKQQIPPIFQCVGTEDFLLEPNRTFHNFLLAENVPHAYFESKGGHDNVFWQEYVVKMVDWMFGD